MFHIVLFRPEIPQNTGNIVRLSVGLGAHVHLIPPLGFSLSDRYLKRAGLDYWEDARVQLEESLEDTVDRANGRSWFLSAHADRTIWEVDFEPGDMFVFGQECCGLPKSIHRDRKSQLLRIPMFGPIRSLNLANAVAVVLYEAARQQREAGAELPSEHLRNGRTKTPGDDL